MNRRIKIILSLFIAVLMVMSAVPMSSFALGWCDISGHKIEWVVTKEATCTETGFKIEKCTRIDCDYETGKTEVISLKPHTVSIIKASAPTCDKIGNTEGAFCSVCNMIIIECNYIPTIGHTLVAISEKPATCTENGRTAGAECSVCKAFITGCVVIPATGHNYGLVSFTAGTCTSAGREVYECKVCGDEKIVTKEAEHDFSGWTTATVATCTNEGLMKRTCRDCGLSESKVVVKLPHTEVVIQAKEATCIEAGMTSGKKCTVCAHITEVCTEIPALGHREKIVAGTPATCGEKGLSDSADCEVCKAITRPQVEIAALEHTITVTTLIKADCYNEGKKVEKCTRVGCNYEKTTVLPKLHEVNWTVDHRATCTADGVQSGFCTSCKQTVVETIPATGHKVTNALSWKVDIAPTCTEEGEKVATCAVCGGQATEPVPAMGHSKEIVTPAVEATCTEYGKTATIKCSNCKIELQKAETVEPIGHDFIVDENKSLPSTCTENGLEYCVCTRCKVTELKEIAASHNYLPAWQTIVQPTCTQTGVSIKICKDCFNIQTNTLETISHTDVNFDGKCDMCGVTGGFVAENCSCNCHKTGIANIFFKFMLFFQKLFGKNQICACGTAHY